MERQNNRQRFIDRERLLRPLMVTVPSQDRLDASIKKLKRLVKESKLMVYLQEKEHFRKPSEIKREKRMRGRAKAQREARLAKEQNM